MGLALSRSMKVSSPNPRELTLICQLRHVLASHVGETRVDPDPQGRGSLPLESPPPRVLPQPASLTLPGSWMYLTFVARPRRWAMVAGQTARAGSHYPEAALLGLPWALVTGRAGIPGPEQRPSKLTHPSTHQGRESPKGWCGATYECVFTATKAPAEGTLSTPPSTPHSRWRPLAPRRGRCCLDPAWWAQVRLLVPSSSRNQHAREARVGGSGGNCPPASGIPPPTAAGSAGTPTAGIPRQGQRPANWARGSCAHAQDGPAAAGPPESPHSQLPSRPQRVTGTRGEPPQNLLPFTAGDMACFHKKPVGRTYPLPPGGETEAERGRWLPEQPGPTLLPRGRSLG